MEPWMIGIFVPFAGMSIPIIAIILKHKEKVAQMQIENEARFSATRSRQDDRRVEELEDRVAVLERIVTDKGYDVASKIEALRHDHRVDADLADLRRVKEGEF